jgi:hypothetical protein
MSLLKKKWRPEAAKSDVKKEGVAGRLVSCVAKMQVAFAKFMDKRVNHLSEKGRKNIFYIFCTISFLSCAYLVVKPFMTSQKNNTVQIETIKFPKHSNKINESIEITTSISKKQYNRIQAFKMYMDSLAANASCVYDSVLLEHPGLMDSIKLFEEFYYFQK